MYVYTVRCTLFRFDKEWKERGRGDVKILKNKDSQRIRLLLRADKTLKVCMNHIILPDIKLTPNMSSDRAWTWVTEDYADAEPTVQTFAIRFKDSEVAAAFKAEYDKAREHNAEVMKNGPVAKTEEKKDETPVWDELINNKSFEPLTATEVSDVWNLVDKSNVSSLDKSDLTAVFFQLYSALHKKLKSDVPEQTATKAQAELSGYVASIASAIGTDGKITKDEFTALEQVKQVSA